MKNYFLFLLLLLSFGVFAQHENEIVEDSLFVLDEDNVADFDMSFAFKTQNYFRGLLPSKTPTLATTVGVAWNQFIIGFYGGVGVDGGYQEVDWILSYFNDRFQVNLEYYYNFTQGISDIPDPSGIFDFNKQTTRGLLDLIIDVNLDNKKKWRLNSSTFIFGRDTDIIEEIINGEVVTSRGDQRYSQYFSLAHNWKWSGGKVEANVGGSFSWTDPGGAQFYGSKAGINDVGVSFTKYLVVNDYVKLPIKAAVLVNPMAETMYLLLTLNLIQVSKL